MTAHSARRARRVNVGLVIQFMIALLFAAIILVPLATAVINGFKTNAELLLSPFSLPKVPQVQNYTEVLTSKAFWRMLFNSLLVMMVTMFGVISLGAMAAYVFARLQFRGRELLYNFFTLGMLFPLAVAILPLYLTIRDVGLVDTYWGLILPQVAFGLPATIVVLRGFFAQVPKEIEESAAIDGASIMRTFFFIVLPIMRPALAAVAVIGMVGSWNAFFWPLLVINTETLYTLPLGVMQFSTQYSTDYGRVLAFITISMIPALVFYLVAERQIVAGLTAGAVKG
jgi:raffinose/stachyose/melibiose transport system permease protein